MSKNRLTSKEIKEASSRLAMCREHDFVRAMEIVGEYSAIARATAPEDIQAKGDRYRAGVRALLQPLVEQGLSPREIVNRLGPDWTEQRVEAAVAALRLSRSEQE